MPKAAALLLLTSLALAACESKAPKRGAAVGPAKGSASTAPTPATANTACSIDPEHPGFMQRKGRARVELSGDGVTTSADFAALCGPLYNTDVPALGVTAGQGLLFETCVPDGLIQLSAQQRAAGAQGLHSALEQGGTEVVFNRNGAATYTSRGAAGDRVALSEDLWKAEIVAVLQDVAGEGKLTAKIRFDCSQ